MNKKTYVFIFIPIVIIGGIIVDRVRPISPEELGIDLVLEEQCENAKRGINSFGENVGYLPELVKNACNPPQGTPTEKEQQEEKAELRSLYDSRWNTSPEIWKLSRDTTEILMRLHRIK